jgi:membrane protein DedA with SNARE-associated domain
VSETVGVFGTVSFPSVVFYAVVFPGAPLPDKAILIAAGYVALRFFFAAVTIITAIFGNPILASESCVPTIGAVEIPVAVLFGRDF